MSKKKVMLLFGGCSPEHGISLQSAYSVIQNINREKYDVILIGITREGKWLRYDGDVDKIKDDTWHNDEKHCAPVLISPDRGKAKITVMSDESEEISVDIVFPVLHGKNGEDGSLQGMFEMLGTPLVGCGTLSSALCMDKFKTHKLVETAGVSVPKGALFLQGCELKDVRAEIKLLRFPLFVKPVNAGSSLGISRISSEDELEEAVKNAFAYDDQILIEEGIEGFEVGCAILGNHELMIGDVDEIELEGDWFDFEEKYTQYHSKIHTPARIEPETAEEIKKIAATIYKTLGCRGFARVDMFLTPEKEVLLNEVNTIPGLTVHSRYPKMLKSLGIGFPEMVELMIKLGFENSNA